MVVLIAIGTTLGGLTRCLASSGLRKKMAFTKSCNMILLACALESVPGMEVACSSGSKLRLHWPLGVRSSTRGLRRVLLGYCSSARWLKRLASLQAWSTLLLETAKSAPRLQVTWTSTKSASRGRRLRVRRCRSWLRRGLFYP